MTTLHISSNHTPAFVREFCTQKFMLCTSVLDEIVLGGLRLDDSSAAQVKKKGGTIAGRKGSYRQVPTIQERLKAIEMYGKFGPGIRVDARGDDGPPRRSVVEMPPWEDEEAEYEDVTVKGELTSGNGDDPASG